MANDDTDRADAGLPPAYDEEQPHDKYPDSDELQEPSILIISGHSIYAESAQSPELYKLNRGVTNLTYATSNVELTRVERSVRRSSDEPTIKLRERHIYDLTNSMQGYSVKMMPTMYHTPRLFVAPVSSRSSLGKRFGLRPVATLSQLRRRVGGGDRVEWQAVSLTRPSDRDSKSTYGAARYEDDPVVLFDIGRESKEGRHEWVDGDGRVVAYEEAEAVDRDGGVVREPKMLVTARMRRVELEALVALWCCRVWMRSAERKEGGSTSSCEFFYVNFFCCLVSICWEDGD